MSEGVVLTPTKRFAGLPVRKAREAVNTFNLMVYGNSGVGKTRLTGSADDVPELRKVLHLDIEGGTMSLRDAHPTVDVIRIQNFNDLKTVYEALRNPGHGYSTVVVDSVNEMQKFNMSSIMIELIKTRTDLDPDIPGMREWGKNLEKTR